MPGDALVIGGGLIGASCAVNLQQHGIRTTLLDPAPAWQRASYGNAGHIATEQVEPLASGKTLRSVPRRLFWRGGALSLPLHDFPAWLPFALRFMRSSSPAQFASGTRALRSLLGGALPAWRRLAAIARAGQLLAEDGHFVVWETPAGAASGRESWLRTDTGTATIRDATDEEVAMLSARMSSRVAGAIRFSGTGQIVDLGELAQRLGESLIHAGGSRRTARVRNLVVDGSTAAAVLDSGETLHAEVVVVAAGVASAALLEPLGYSVPIIAERGYHIQCANTDWPVGLPPVVFEERSMIVTRFRSGLRAASFVEFARDRSPADPRKWARLRQHVAELGLPFREPSSEWFGARPTLPDYLPALGRSRRAANLLYAFGHQHLGLTLAAISGELIAALARREPAAVDVMPFDLERFH
ncbi:MAG TPA: FAD-binding oxidoreductase [Steroidobacteraceae bacterium]|nr:FAD-binding oxidoreductase [Steroidobacteraceae bacterium]